MSALELLRFAAEALSGHRLRTALSVVGVAIGVAAVVVLTALGEGARRYVIEQFGALGTNLLVVVPGRNETTGGLPGVGGVPHDLTIDDADALRRQLPQAQTVAPVSMGTESVASGSRRRQVAVIGSTHELMEARGLQMRLGRFLPRGDWHRGAPVVVLGHRLARELFPGQMPVGEVVRIGEWRMRVIGVLAPQGFRFGIDLDDVAVVPVATGMRMFNRSSLFRILVKVAAYQELEAAEARAGEVLRQRHGEEDFTLITREAVVATFSTILTALTMAVAGIAAISLAVAGIGIMNVMLVSVAERTEEVGLLKAVGVGRGQILAAFLTEAVLLSSAGGLLGLGAGWAAVRLLVALYPAVPASPPPWAVGAALAVAVAVGATFGALPARRATRLDPVAALARR